MKNDRSDGPSLVLILSDGIRGHLHQSEGIARWISRNTGADIVRMDVPKYGGGRRALLLKLLGRRLPKLDRLGTRRWLHWTGEKGLALLECYRKALDERGLSGSDSLVISTGSSAAPFCLALSKVMGGKSCVVMTPSVIGVEPFDYGVVPSHDGICGGSAIETLGAPNFVSPEDLERSAEKLLRDHPGSEEKWGVLVGGDDQNYRLDATWADMTVGVLLRIAEERGLSLYITTSRRTSLETEKRIREICKDNDRVSMLLLASESDENPVPGILGACDRVFCTEDSVSMISEAATSGSKVYLLRVGRQPGWRRFAQEFTVRLIKWKILPERFSWGTPRFDRMIDRFVERGLLTEMPSDVMAWRPMLNRPVGKAPEFNEARRAADWILENWK
ncbi:mitochondrial fission ELM1 family protein [Dethiosulfovibrio sp. F2B]|uniref:mitochondrial fission ELM1 family protein n=1 Tax=Dethiosulfovibrio faecalis TaxID=2720018 RepID=UPI001F336A34|nr:ELM1/GtrOC1 family putative glycosyltransferase [Dethiosulfovibrio faecalis]MCF4150669.1 mitochondrial fission ELM1 family protein [Dethiosulfovibrio faecalis]